MKRNIYGKLQNIDTWVRFKLKYCIWHTWKKPDRKINNLIRLGVNPNQAYAFSRRLGGWAVAKSPISGTTVTVTGLKSRLDLYLYLMVNESPHTRPVVWWCERCTLLNEQSHLLDYVILIEA